MPDLVLGTAQWGSDYGITNARGRVSDDDVRAIVEQSDRCGVGAIDTALSYGDSQARVAPYADHFWVSTKVSAAGDVSAQVVLCLEQLQVTRLDAVMLHDWDAVGEGVRLSAVHVLGECMADGLAERAGVSVYSSEGVQTAVSAFAFGECDLGIVQVPANALDRRLDACDVLTTLHSEGCVIQVRSVFLQGLLAGPGGGAHGEHADVRAFHEWASEQPGGAVGAALAHVKALPWASQVVVGATSVDEWAEVCAAWEHVAPRRAPEHLASGDEVLLDPRSW